MPYTIAIDLDGTLIDWERGRPYRVNRFGPLLPGAREFVTDMHHAGHRIIIHTCRTSPRVNPGYTVTQLAEIVARELDSHSLPYDEIWCDNSKPIADVYIDDRAIRFTNWEDVREIMEVECA